MKDKKKWKYVPYCRLIVAGSRTFTNYDLLKRKLNYYTTPIGKLIVLCGGAIGADVLGQKWAEYYWIDRQFYKPDYKTHGKIAPLVRNTEMAENADMLICFWDGKSSGSKDMIEKAKARDLRVVIVRF
jgi:hypothetical protein